MDIVHNLELGLKGEQLVSNALDELGVFHEHHNFETIHEYSKSMGKGPDCWSAEFEIEVKNFPNSVLSSKSHYDVLVKSRFTPNAINKILIAIDGVVKDSFVNISNKDKVYSIHTEPKYLKSKIQYVLKKLGVIKDSKYSPIVHITHTNETPVKEVSSPLTSESSSVSQENGQPSPHYPLNSGVSLSGSHSSSQEPYGIRVEVFNNRISDCPYLSSDDTGKVLIDKPSDYRIKLVTITFHEQASPELLADIVAQESKKHGADMVMVELE